MARRPSAFYDPDPHAHGLSNRRALRPRIVATVDRMTGPLSGMDAVRIDAATNSLDAIARLRSRYLCPAILDLPGAGTGPVSSPLTTTELLVFASAERFDWVSLRGVTRAEAVRRAKLLLHPSVRLAVSIGASSVCEESLPEISRHADALVLDRCELLRSLGEARGWELLQHACQFAALGDIPCMVSGGLLEAARRDPTPTQGDVERLDHLLSVGARYLILDEETRSAPLAQSAVDSLRLLLDAGGKTQRSPSARNRAARLSGRLTLARDDGSVLDPRR